VPAFPVDLAAIRWSEPDRGGDHAPHGRAPKGGAQLLGAGDEQGPHLVEGVDAGVGGRAASDPQRPDGLNIAAAGLGLRGCLAVLGGASGRDRVDRVGLAVAAPTLAVRTRHLDHRHPWSCR
jgi:hypothetical protein